MLGWGKEVSVLGGFEVGKRKSGRRRRGRAGLLKGTEGKGKGEGKLGPKRGVEGKVSLQVSLFEPV